MTDTYPKMHKVNELAAELINQLNMYHSNILAEISYAAYDELNAEVEYLIMRDWDEEGARDKAADNLAKYQEENGMETPYAEELEIIAAAIKILSKLVQAVD
jgi:hypothetical protein